EFTVVAAAVVGALGGARALPVPVAIALRDKQKQKNLIRAAGLPTARSATADTAADITDTALKVGGYPIVVKPLAGAGARDTVRLSSANEAATWANGQPHTGPWLVEEFITGAEYHVDGVIRNGQLLTCAVSRYLHNLIDVHDGALVGSVCLTPDEHPDLYRTAEHLTTHALAALNHTDGVFHLEAFRQPDNTLIFGECAGRVGGGRIDQVVRHSFGTDLHDHWAAAALNTPAPPKHPTEGGTLGFVHLTAQAGVIESMPT
ncbi:acetyl-CoA carboxylase biotin carboxylase subunit family protein, partial [Streptomyces sp. AC555_RSS877]|uniref:ATP-grasp domain-containing protein n=1 Tax=Streptomyces sp. AC555_RSS877 TaxID=2823688 RepID=UPI001C26CA38